MALKQKTLVFGQRERLEWPLAKKYFSLMTGRYALTALQNQAVCWFCIFGVRSFLINKKYIFTCRAAARSQVGFGSSFPEAFVTFGFCTWVIQLIGPLFSFFHYFLNSNLACNFCLQFLLAISACNFCLQFLLANFTCKCYQFLKILKKIQNFRKYLISLKFYDFFHFFSFFFFRNLKPHGRQLF